jgi:ABC-2 type transport system permease protein
MVQDKAGELWFTVYQLNPITVAVEAFHHAFWLPTTSGAEGSPPNLLTVWIPVGLLVSLAILFLGQCSASGLSAGSRAASHRSFEP